MNSSTGRIMLPAPMSFDSSLHCNSDTKVTTPHNQLTMWLIPWSSFFFLRLFCFRPFYPVYYNQVTPERGEARTSKETRARANIRVQNKNAGPPLPHIRNSSPDNNFSLTQELQHHIGTSAPHKNFSLRPNMIFSQAVSRCCIPLWYE